MVHVSKQTGLLGTFHTVKSYSWCWVYVFIFKLYFAQSTKGCAVKAGCEGKVAPKLWEAVQIFQTLGMAFHVDESFCI